MYRRYIVCTAGRRMYRACIAWATGGANVSYIELRHRRESDCFVEREIAWWRRRVCRRQSYCTAGKDNVPHIHSHVLDSSFYLLFRIVTSPYHFGGHTAVIVFVLFFCWCVLHFRWSRWRRLLSPRRLSRGPQRRRLCR